LKHYGKGSIGTGNHITFVTFKECNEYREPLTLKTLNTGSIRKFAPPLFQRYKRSGTEKNIVMIVALTALIFVAASAVMSQWSIREMSKIVRGQFNEEQMVIAHNVKNFIEREFSFLKREMESLSSELESGEDPDKKILLTLSHVIESGISKIEFYDRDAGIVHIGHPFHKKVACSPIEASPPLSHNLDRGKIKQLTVSKLQVTSSGVFVILALPVGHSGSRLLCCRVNVSWLLGPNLKNIRSGQTGYAWIIDGAGRVVFKTDK
jgi:hypothetical protein